MKTKDKVILIGTGKIDICRDMLLMNSIHNKIVAVEPTPAAISPPLYTSDSISIKNTGNVKQIIEAYNCILSGTSSLGVLKQARIITRVELWLKSGLISKEDLSCL